MNNLDPQYIVLLKKVLTAGIRKKDRTGTGTVSIFGATIRHNMSEGFPVLTTKKVAFKTMVTELKWFLRGETNIRPLVKSGCNIWNGDAYKQYQRACAYELEREELTYNQFIDKIKNDLSFARIWGDLGPIYGNQWRNWNGTDQIAELIKKIKNNPDDRRLIVSAWNVSDLNKMALPPCHYSFQCYVADGKLSLMWNQRSADLFLGVPFNISSYGLLLLLLCKETGLKPGELIGNFGDLHLYTNHLNQASRQITRTPYPLPLLVVNRCNINNGTFTYALRNYKSHPAIRAKLSN